MLQQKSSLLVKVGERTYELMCDGNSPLGELHDVIMQMKSYIVKRITEAHEAETKKPDDAPVVEPTEVQVS